MSGNLDIFDKLKEALDPPTSHVIADAESYEF